jgi:hypothetical protein
VVRFVKYDEGAKGLLVLMLFIQLFLTNGILLFFGAMVFAFLFYYIQQPYKPAVFTVIFFYHFIQVAAGVWLSNFKGVDINFRSDNTSMAIILSYFGLFALFAPIIYYHLRVPSVKLSTIREHAYKLDIRACFKAYLIAFFAMNALEALAFVLSGLTQIVFSLVAIKWMFYLLFGYQVFIKKRMLWIFVLFSGFEFVSGFYSYFSEFKTVLFFLLLLALFFMRSISLKQMVFGLSSGIIVFLGMAYYQGIKGEYREYLNQGSKSQTVSVEKGAALNKLAEIASKNEKITMGQSIEGFLDRFQYTYHLARAMDYVPAIVPHQNGKNWGTTLEFSLTPRLLNPDKPNYEASVKTTRYTGIVYARAAQGVSVSLGYFADSYVDFGIYGMFLPLLIIGFVMGITYFYFVRRSSNNYLFNFAVVGAMYMEFFAYEMDSTFLTGRLFAKLLTFFMLKQFFFPWLIKQLSVKKGLVDQPEVPIGMNAIVS